jgi:hypothetical protein
MFAAVRAGRSRGARLGHAWQSRDSKVENAPSHPSSCKKSIYTRGYAQPCRHRRHAPTKTRRRPRQCRHRRHAPTKTRRPPEAEPPRQPLAIPDPPPPEAEPPRGPLALHDRRCERTSRRTCRCMSRCCRRGNRSRIQRGRRSRQKRTPERSWPAALFLASFCLACHRRLRPWLHRDLYRIRPRLKDEFRIGEVDVEVPIREFCDEIRLPRQRAVGHDQPARQRLFVSAATVRARRRAAEKRTGDHTEPRRS